MKYIWSIIAIVIIIGVVLWGTSKRTHTTVTPPPPQEAAVAGPQEPVQAKAFNANAPLSKNKVIFQNGMKIEITKEGSGTPIANGEVAVVQYVGKFENGTVFDASKNHGDGTFSFTVGAGQVIKGWDQGVLGMKVGESRTLTIPSELGYGPNGIPGAIPGNATLIFDVALVTIK